MVLRPEGGRRDGRPARSQLATAAAIGLAAAIAGLALLSVDPLVFPIRVAFVGALAVLASLACVAALVTRRRLAAGLLAGAAAYAAWQGARPALDRAAVLARGHGASGPVGDGIPRLACQGLLDDGLHLVLLDRSSPGRTRLVVQQAVQAFLGQSAAASAKP